MVRFSKYIVIFILLSKVVVKVTTNFIAKLCPKLYYCQRLYLIIKQSLFRKSKYIILFFFLILDSCLIKKKLN